MSVKSPYTHAVSGANLASLPVILLGLMMVIFSLNAAPWPADYKDANQFTTATHRERLLGDDVPGDVDVERTSGYTMRRVLDGSIYVAFVFISLAWLTALVVHRDWVFLPMIGIGVFGVMYAATSGLTAGPLICGAGFALILFGAVFGWASSPKSRQYTE